MEKFKFTRNPNIRMWSAEDNERVRAMFIKGYSDAEIGEALGRTQGAVEQQRHKLKLKKVSKHRRDFCTFDPAFDYYPNWYKKIVKEKWRAQRLTSTR